MNLLPSLNLSNSLAAQVEIRIYPTSFITNNPQLQEQVRILAVEALSQEIVAVAYIPRPHKSNHSEQPSETEPNEKKLDPPSILRDFPGFTTHPDYSQFDSTETTQTPDLTPSITDPSPDDSSIWTVTAQDGTTLATGHSSDSDSKHKDPRSNSVLVINAASSTTAESIRKLKHRKG